jgi:hypothetical protein
LLVLARLEQGHQLLVDDLNKRLRFAHQLLKIGVFHKLHNVDRFIRVVVICYVNASRELFAAVRK